MRLFSLYPSICSNVPFLCLVISLVEWQNSPACLRQPKKQRNLVTQFDLAATFVLFLSGNKSCVYFLFWSFKASNICSEIITLGAFFCFPVNSILYLVTVFISLLGYTILLLVLNLNWRNFVDTFWFVCQLCLIPLLLEIKLLLFSVQPSDIYGNDAMSRSYWHAQAGGGKSYRTW